MSNSSMEELLVNDAVDDDATSHATLSAAITACPSHIMPDGTYVHLPLPNEYERTRFFERAVAKHGLLQDDLKATKTTTKRSREDRDDDAEDHDEKQEAGKKSKSGSTEPQIHPLALASARIQSNGINELNRAINLQTLVATGEYFGLSNIVDPSFDRSVGKAAPKGNNTSSVSGSGNTGVIGTVNGGTTAPGVSSEEEARVRAIYVLQCKGEIYRQAANTLKRHRRRLIAAIVSQRKIDARWRELRRFWRLVAPEHGTRALPHPVKTTEVICADVDVYHLTAATSQIGRLSGHKPRYATIELTDDYKVTEDVKEWLREKISRNDVKVETPQNAPDPMDTDQSENVTRDLSTLDSVLPEVITSKKAARICTKAQPFAIADPTIGKDDADFDPTSVTMLTLQFTIEKPSTGCSVSVCLEPFTTVSSHDNSGETKMTDELRKDERILMELQHSLFCAKLFESMRQEVAPDKENYGPSGDILTQSAAWLTGNSDENYLPPPSLMIGSNRPGLSPICIIHIHDGDFKVVLDCEYTLNAKLVEPSTRTSNGGDKHANGTMVDSGSQTPTQLNTLCQALLLHAQETYHRHSIQEEARLCREQEEMEAKQAIFLKENPHVKVIPPVKKKHRSTSPFALQTCTSLGAKMLFESRIRKSLRKVKDWIVRSFPGVQEKLRVEWLVLPLFDLTAQLTVSFGSWYIDANIVGDAMTITNFGENGEYHKVKFHSDKQFEIFLMTALRRVVFPPKERDSSA